MSTVQERVARGAAWLDAASPGWRDQINLDSLNLWSTRMCVLGQTFGDMLAGSRVLCRTAETRCGFELSDYGFNAEILDDSDVDAAASCAETEALVAEWRRVIHQPVAMRGLVAA